MKRSLLLAAAVATIVSSPAVWALQDMSGSNLGAVTGGDFKAAQDVLQRRCTACHTTKRIDAAIASHKNMGAIENSMEKKGARLTQKEREVLGIYWKQDPLKKK